MFNELCNKSCSLREDYGWLKWEQIRAFSSTFWHCLSLVCLCARITGFFQCSYSLSPCLCVCVYMGVPLHWGICKTWRIFVSSHFRLCIRREKPHANYLIAKTNRISCCRCMCACSLCHHNEVLRKTKASNQRNQKWNENNNLKTVNAEVSMLAISNATVVNPGFSVCGWRKVTL